MGIIEKIIDEPLGGAHRDKPAAISAVGNAIGDALDELSGVEGGGPEIPPSREIPGNGCKGVKLGSARPGRAQGKELEEFHGR